MQFAPRPENDFRSYILTYYRQCQSRFPKIQAIAGKWMFRDLFPGMSDFDTRFIVSDDMTAEDWCEMSTQVGQAHLDLCRKYPGWARNLEHLPGINLTWSELRSEESYYPEYQLWSFYDTEAPDQLGAALKSLAERRWDIKDEYFHVKRFLQFYGPYDRGIDPPINLGVHANKYPLHSRLMHYFCPPIHSAICLIQKQNMPGKLSAFEMAASLFPGLVCWEMIQEILHAGYEFPAYYQEPCLTELEQELEKALKCIANELPGCTSLIPSDAGIDMNAWKQALQDVPLDPALVIFDHSKFARLMKGRLSFYLNAPAFFQTTWLLQNELRRIRSNFFVVPFRMYWKFKGGETVPDPVMILEALKGDPLTPEEVEGTRQFALLTDAYHPGEERSVAASLVQIYDLFYKSLAHLAETV